MNKETCPFLTGNERMNLVISEAYITRLLYEQFEQNDDQPYVMLHEVIKRKISIQEDKQKQALL